MAKGKITKEQELLLYVLKRAVKGVKDDFFDFDLSDVDWKSFINESFFQAVSYITFENSVLLKPYVPEELYKKWTGRIVSVVVSNVSVVNAQKNLISMIGENRKYLILKGLSSASYYPNPELRDLGDVDFLIADNEQEEVKNILIENGYECRGEGNDHHTIFRKPTEILEMHFEINGVPQGVKGEKVRSFMAGALGDGKKTTLGSDLIGEFFAPDKMRQGLILILHMQHHMLYGGLGLRHLLDWAYYINKTEGEPFWQELLAFFKEIGIFVYAATMTKTCSLYLGSDCPKWCEDVPDSLCEEVMLDILSLGNFGHRDINRSKSGLLIYNHGEEGVAGGTKGRLWQQFKISVKSRHKSLEKHKILFPFFCVWEFFRYSFEAICGKKPKIKKLLKDAKDRKSVYEKLHVFESEQTE